MRRLRPRVSVVGLSLLLLVFVLPAFAQYGASIQGTVTDQTGAVVPNATVTATNDATGVAKTATSSDSGYYRVAGLPPGIYTVKIEGTSFASVVSKGGEVTAAR